MIRRVLLAVLLGLFLRAPAQAATAQQYDHALAQVQAALEARIPVVKEHEIPSTTPPQYVARRVLAPITSVGPAGGPQQTVNNRELLQALALADRKGDAAGMTALDDQISTLRAELSRRSVSPAASDQAVAQARAILAGPDYACTPFPPPPLSERIARWLDDQLNKIHWPHSTNAPNVSLPSISPAFIRALMIIVLVGAVGVLVFVFVQLLSGRAMGARATPLLDQAEQALVEARDTDSLFALAEREANEGEYRRAFRLVYVAMLIALDTTGVLRFDRSRTNWEYLRTLRAAGREDVYRAMMPLTREFDRIWYGFAPATRADYSRAVAQYQALQSVSASPANAVSPA